MTRRYKENLAAMIKQELAGTLPMSRGTYRTSRGNARWQALDTLNEPECGRCGRCGLHGDHKCIEVSAEDRRGSNLED